MKLAYGEFERRVGQAASPKGAKTEMIEAAIASMPSSFTVADLERACPGVSRDLIRKVLRQLKQAEEVEPLGRGPARRGGKEVVPLKKGKRDGDETGAPVCVAHV